MGVTERRKREKEVRRELAIDAAMSMYREEGYHAITMERIAERAELSRATLYLYFNSKEQIFVTAIVSLANYFSGLLQELYDGRENLKAELLERLWECFQKVFEKDPVRFRAWQYFHQADAIGGLPSELRDTLHQAGAGVVILQHKIVEYAIAEGIFIDCDHRALSEVIWSLFLGIGYLEQSKKLLSDKSHLAATLDMARKILSRGVTHSFPKKNVGGCCGLDSGEEKS